MKRLIPAVVFAASILCFSAFAHDVNRAAKGDRDSRAVRLEKFSEVCRKFITAAPNEELKQITTFIVKWREEQKVVQAKTSAFAANCPMYKSDPSIANVAALNQERREIQAAIVARDGVKVERRMSLFFRFYTSSTAGNTLDKFGCGQGYEDVSKDIFNAKEAVKKTVDEGCFVKPPVKVPPPEQRSRRR